MIYHFCNSAFGHAFRLLAAEFGRRHDVPITTVMSRPPRRDNDLPKPLVVSDINSPAFADRIAPGDHAVMTGFNQIFLQSSIDRFASFANIHSSVLPFYRGPSPTYWCIQNAETLTGYTLHTVTASIDSGTILYQEVVPIEGVRDPACLSGRIAAAAGATFVNYLDHLRSGSPWESKVIDATTVYATHAGYQSFPPRDR